MSLILIAVIILLVLIWLLVESLFMPRPRQ